LRHAVADILEHIANHARGRVLDLDSIVHEYGQTAPARIAVVDGFYAHEATAAESPRGGTEMLSELVPTVGRRR
jgi:hypothetical protein